MSLSTFFRRLFGRKRKPKPVPRDSYPGRFASECVLAKSESFAAVNAALVAQGREPLPWREGWVVKAHECDLLVLGQPRWYSVQNQRMVGGLTWPPSAWSEIGVYGETIHYPSLLHEATHFWIGPTLHEWGHPKGFEAVFGFADKEG